MAGGGLLMWRMKVDPNIHGYLGYWGSGKSLMMAAEVRRRERNDPKLIVGNNFGFKANNPVELHNLQDAIDFCTMKTPGWRKLLVLDEIQALARARGHALFPPAADVVFQQGRKLGLSILWTSQQWKLLDVNIRRVTDRVTVCEPFIGKRISAPGELPVRKRPVLIRCKTFRDPDPDSVKLPERPDSVHWFAFRQAVADSYDTMKLVDASLELLQEQAARQRNVELVDAVEIAIQAPELLRPVELKRSGLLSRFRYGGRS